MIYVCGDGERFSTPEDAILHASRVFESAGNIISIEEESPLDLVCARYGVKVPQSDADWKPLALALMKANGYISVAQDYRIERATLKWNFKNNLMVW